MGYLPHTLVTINSWFKMNENEVTLDFLPSSKVKYMVNGKQLKVLLTGDIGAPAINDKAFLKSIGFSTTIALSNAVDIVIRGDWFSNNVIKGARNMNIKVLDANTLMQAHREHRLLTLLNTVMKL